MSRLQIHLAMFVLSQENQAKNEELEAVLQAQVFAVDPERWSAMYSEEAQAEREEDASGWQIPQNEAEMHKMMREAGQAMEALGLE